MWQSYDLSYFPIIRGVFSDRKISIHVFDWKNLDFILFSPKKIRKYFINLYNHICNNEPHCNRLKYPKSNKKTFWALICFFCYYLKWKSYPLSFSFEDKFTGTKIKVIGRWKLANRELHICPRYFKDFLSSLKTKGLKCKTNKVYDRIENLKWKGPN